MYQYNKTREKYVLNLSSHSHNWFFFTIFSTIITTTTIRIYMKIFFTIGIIILFLERSLSKVLIRSELVEDGKNM